MAQFSLIIMRTTILTNLTEECHSCLSYYTQESNKRLPSFLPSFHKSLLLLLVGVSSVGKVHFASWKSLPESWSDFTLSFPGLQGSRFSPLEHCTSNKLTRCCLLSHLLSIYICADEHTFRKASVEYIFIWLGGKAMTQWWKPEGIFPWRNKMVLFETQQRVSWHHL